MINDLNSLREFITNKPIIDNNDMVSLYTLKKYSDLELILNLFYKNIFNILEMDQNTLDILETRIPCYIKENYAIIDFTVLNIENFKKKYIIGIDKEKIENFKKK